MAQALPLDVGRRDPDVDLAFVQVLRLALRGCRVDDAAVERLRAAHDRSVLNQTLGRLERLLDDEPTVTVERARSLVLAALGVDVLGRSA
jgi:hypothetical protein